MPGLADLQASLGENNQAWRGHPADTQARHRKAAGKSSSKDPAPTASALREVSQEGYLGVKLNYAEVRASSLLF